MNSHQAKQIDLPDLLARLGHHPVKVRKGGRELWYTSPFREERTPSFHTSYLGGKWIWKDFGDTGGTVIDFVMRYEGISFKQALAFLRKMYPEDSLRTESREGTFQELSKAQFSFQQQDHKNGLISEDDRELEFLEAHEIRNQLILEYLECKRKIPANLAKQYLWEVTYRNKTLDKVFFAFGMKNESGGYEIRSASDQYIFKSALIKRDITFIKGRGENSRLVSVFEGMTDFLSLLVLSNGRELKGNTIIMHSVSSFNRTIDFIQSRNYETIYTYLDNDVSGSKCLREFGEIFNEKILNMASLYQKYLDLNEALVGGFSENQVIPKLSR